MKYKSVEFRVTKDRPQSLFRPVFDRAGVRICPLFAPCPFRVRSVYTLCSAQVRPWFDRGSTLYQILIP